MRIFARMKNYLLTKYYFKLIIWDKSRYSISKTVRIDGVPIVNITKGANLVIAHNVRLNSDNIGYHINMHSPLKLFADRKGAQIIIGSNTRIHGSCIHAYKKIQIGKNCLIAANCQIFDSNGHELSFPNVENRINTTGEAKEIVIEDNVWIGANSIILPGVTIGYGSVIAAGSVVIGDIPHMCIAGGNPAKVIKHFETIHND